jgi:hypothetical protein
LKAKKALEEARKAGKVPAELDDEGKVIYILKLIYL